MGKPIAFKWGPRNSRELENWGRAIHFIREWNYFDCHKGRWGWFALLSFIPCLKNLFNNRIALYEFRQ